jgi:hypothetical protein
MKVFNPDAGENLSAGGRQQQRLSDSRIEMVNMKKLK